MRPELGEPGVHAVQAGDLGEDGGRVEDGDVVPVLNHGGDDVARLRQVR